MKMGNPVLKSKKIQSMSDRSVKTQGEDEASLVNGITAKTAGKQTNETN